MARTISITAVPNQYIHDNNIIKHDIKCVNGIVTKGGLVEIKVNCGSQLFKHH